MRYFYTIAGFVANGVPVYIIGPMASERTIIEDAQLECARSGGSLAAGDELSAALMKLNEKTKVYEVFDCDDPLDTQRFIAAAGAVGLGAEACRLAFTVGSHERRKWNYGHI